MAKGSAMAEKNLKAKKELVKIIKESQAVDIIDKGWDYLNSGKKAYPMQGCLGRWGKVYSAEELDMRVSKSISALMSVL